MIKSLSLLAGFALSAYTSSALTIAQIDTFQDGTTADWVTALLGSPNPNPPINVATGGPGGPGDSYLRATSSGGAGPGSRLSVINASQWTGNYLAAGVTSIAMDVNNLGPNELALRLMFADPQGGPPTDIAFSTDAVLVPAGSGWVHIVFPVSEASLTAGLGSIANALSHTTELRIYHSLDLGFPNPVFPIPGVAAQLGIDNIQTAVPDGGSTSALLTVGALALASARRDQRRVRE